MRDINRLDKFYDELKEIHKKNFPMWRFGQIIVNVLADWQAKTGRDIFFPEEDEMIQIFRNYVKDMKIREATDEELIKEIKERYGRNQREDS